jgi:hypothetical protein
LILLFGDGSDGGVVFEIAEGEMESLLFELEGGVDIDDPIDENLFHSLCDIFLGVLGGGGVGGIFKFI